MAAVKSEAVTSEKDTVLLSNLKDEPKKKPITIKKLDAAFRAYRDHSKKRIDRLSEKVRTYDPKNMLAMEKRHAELSTKFQMLIEKVTVITEVGYSIRHNKHIDHDKREKMLAAAIWSFDQPDDWWKNTESVPVEKFVMRCYEAYRKAQQEQIISDQFTDSIVKNMVVSDINMTRAI